MIKAGLVYSDDYLKHDTGSHPERAARLMAILSRLKEEGLYQKLTLIEPNPDSEADILKVHARGYLERVKLACEQGGGYLDPDTVVSSESYRVALLAAGGVMAAADKIMQGQVARAFCLIRPPGHHATRDQAMGFCLFNNIAIGARYLQNRYELTRILIVDWDLHHGNGTQEIFYADDTVLYFSCHQRDHYPLTGWEEEKGEGRGEGFTLNLPFRAGTSEQEMISAIEERLLPAVQAFNPEFVLLSAGFDAHKDDPLGSLMLTEAGYLELTRMVCDIADNCCSGRLISCLEGGYNLEALASSVTAHVRGILGEKGNKT